MWAFLINNEFARIIFLVLLFAIVASLAAIIGTIVTRRMQVRAQLGTINPDLRLAAKSVSLRHDTEDAWTRLANRIEQSGLSLGDTKGDALVELMRSAGFDSPVAPRIYTLLRLALVILLPTLAVTLVIVVNGEIGLGTLYFGGAIAALAGLYIPNIYVRSRAANRRRDITNGFPDCLDLTLVCMEAGLGLEGALDRVGREMILLHPLVSRLLVGATLQMRAGASREVALRRLAIDAGVDEISSFATLLIQSDKLGTSIAATLRVYAAEMRERRRMRAEEKAHRIPVLISIPLVACMLPTMIGTLMLPAAVRVVRSLLPQLTGGG